MIKCGIVFVRNIRTYGKDNRNRMVRLKRYSFEENNRIVKGESEHLDKMSVIFGIITIMGLPLS